MADNQLKDGVVGSQIVKYFAHLGKVPVEAKSLGTDGANQNKYRITFEDGTVADYNVLFSRDMRFHVLDAEPLGEVTESGVMTDAVARTIIEEMLDAAIRDVASFKVRISDLEADFNADPSPDTAAQIKRTKERMERRIKEGSALAIASVKL